MQFHRDPILLDPVTLIGIGTGLTALTTLSQGISAQQQGKYNQKVAEQNAEAIRRSASNDEEIFEDEFQTLLGEQQAAATAQGTLSSVGSPLNIQRETFLRFLRDKRNREINTGTAVGQQESIGQQERTRGRGTLFGSLLGAAGTTATDIGRALEKDNG